MSLASWYNTQYATWHRTRSLQQRPFVARPDTNISRTATAMHNADSSKDKKSQDSLFGPSIGVVSSGPAWTNTSEKKVLTDELTPDIVSSWVTKSKDTSHPTTTLQALVNLKRPTLRLSPLSPEDEPTTPGATNAHHHHHGLEFEYDCDAPKCGIYVHVLLHKDHPDAPATSSSSGLSKSLVFESVVEGGFGKLLKIEDGALLELGHFEHSPATSKLLASTSVSGEPAPTTTDPSGTPAETNSTTTPTARNPRRRFTHLHFRKRSHGRSVAGPALAVVDADPAHAEDAKGKDNTNEGVRVTIRLAALDEQGTELASPNEQVTYLHVVRFGSRAEGADPTEDDTRPWLVKVVKREATIGPHTFHLHEIYGLTSPSTAAHAPAPTAPLPNADHTYPPPATPGTESQSLMPPVTPVIAADDSEPQSECLLCLSSPREVVLLPCRHLVACKDCALNMVEFGAGGNINQAEAPVMAGGDESTAGHADDAATGDAPVSPVTPAPGTPAATNPNARRKRKAKGWFCPVCRQPYTSLLRITASSPPPQSERNKEAASTEGGEANTNEGGNNEDNSRATGGRIGGTFAPSFFRGLSFGRAAPNDVENQAGANRAGT